MFCNQSWHSIATIIAIASCIGCNPRPVGETIQGLVTIQGVPLKEGLITFQPIEKTRGPKISTVIENGKYQVTSEDGIYAGTFRVEILGIPPGVKAMAEGRQSSELFRHGEASQSLTTRSDYQEIATEFNFQSQLRTSLQAGVDNRQDFQVDYVSPQ